MVIGAGCSKEAPTDLPLSEHCSLDAHRSLIADGLLGENECSNPNDLSTLADVVIARYGGRQTELVKRLPVTRLRNASPNEGHKITAVLLVEGAISNVVTLNFDLALNHALAEVGAGGSVSIVNGPEQHDQLSRANVIYLHRNIDADPEDLILTTRALDEAWKDQWEECITNHAIVAPVTVFAGLGSSCGVLSHAANRLKSALGSNARLLLVDPGERQNSKFAIELEISEDKYVQLGWVDFMRKLGKRFHIEIVTRIKDKCEELSHRERWVDPITHQPTENIDTLAEQIEKMDLLSFGKARTAWLLDLNSYSKLEAGHISSISDLLLAIEYINKQRNFSTEILDDGHVSFSSTAGSKIRIRLVDGSSKNYRWLSLEHFLRKQDQSRKYGQEITMRILACGITGKKPVNVTLPQSILDGVETNSIVGSDSSYSFCDVEEIREDDKFIDELLS